MSAGNWFKDKTWSISGNKENTLEQLQQDVKQNDAVIYYPESTKEIAELLASNQKSAVAVVCGGHSSSNVATWAYHSVSEGASEGNDDSTIILDMKKMSSVTVDKESMEVTVGGGTTLGELAKVCSDAGGALPIGTGDTVGVCGYTLNGGLSGYFGKRLGMLGQRVVSLEIVIADGSVKNLTPTSSGDDGKLFHACLGAGSAMGVVTSLTFQMESESSFNTGGSIVVACGNKTCAAPFLKRALHFMKNQVLSTSSCSMEIVIVTDYTVIINFMFYDTFTGDTKSFVQQVRDDAKAYNVKILTDDVNSFKTWFEAASSLWGVIADLKGDPMVRVDHCIGTRSIPSDEALDFVIDTWVGEYLETAPLSLVEIRSLGGPTKEGSMLPSGNVNAIFFADMIVSYDGSSVSSQNKSSIMEEVHRIIVDAKNQGELMVDFSGTHSQSDDRPELLAKGDEIFGSQDNYELIQQVKQTFDSTNRFRFHPFTHLLWLHEKAVTSNC